MNQAQQPDALRLADEQEALLLSVANGNLKVGKLPLEPFVRGYAELRRLHARVQELECQQKREPLSYQQIRDAWYDCGIGTTYDIPPSQDDIDWARAIERAHGITAQPEYHADDERDHSDEDAAIAAGKVQAAVQERTT